MEGSSWFVRVRHGNSEVDYGAAGEFAECAQPSCAKEVEGGRVERYERHVLSCAVGCITLLHESLLWISANGSVR